MRTAFPRLKWLRERFLGTRYTYIACLIWFSAAVRRSEGLCHDLLVGKDLEGGFRLERQKPNCQEHHDVTKCQQWAYLWQPWRCVSRVAVHRVGLPLGRAASPRFRDKQWTVGRKW